MRTIIVLAALAVAAPVAAQTTSGPVGGQPPVTQTGGSGGLPTTSPAPVGAPSPGSSTVGR